MYIPVCSPSLSSSSSSSTPAMAAMDSLRIAEARTSGEIRVVITSRWILRPERHARRLFDGLASKDKSFVEIQGADHYYMARPDLLPQAVAAVTSWLDARGF